MLVTRIEAQNRGVYPLGMNAVNSGLMPAPGFTYTNQLLTYARDEAKADDGSTLPVSGSNTVVMDLNTIAWPAPRPSWEAASILHLQPSRSRRTISHRT